MSAGQQVLAWLGATVALWAYLWGLGAWALAAPPQENWIDESTWGLR